MSELKNKVKLLKQEIPKILISNGILLIALSILGSPGWILYICMFGMTLFWQIPSKSIT